MVQRQRLLEQFFELVQIDSETKHEEQIGQYLTTKFTQLGLHVQEDNSKQKTGHGYGNLICTLSATPGMENKNTVFFTSHMDTVTPGNGIKPRLDEDGYIRSDGTTILGSDDKAGITAMIEAIQVLKEQQIAHGKVQFVITAGEESGLVGSLAMDRSMMEADFGYAIDSNGKIGEIAIAAPTQAKIDFSVIGRSAHAGVNPEAGISAIQVASKAISRMKLGRIDHETTANIGKFTGGTATNIVCERVDIEAEARSLKQDKLDQQVASMKEALESAVQEFGAELQFSSEIVYPAYYHDDDTPVVQLAMKAFRKIGIEPSTFPSGGGSDANIFNGMGIPTVNLAVGYEHIHTTKEQIALDDLEAITKAIVAIIEEVAAD